MTPSTDGAAATAEKAHIVMAGSAFAVCSVGMTVFNKFAIQAFQLECLLVALQMFSTVVLVLCFCWRTVHVGSWWDVLLWCRVVPCFVGVLMTSILALKGAPMSLVIVFRNLAPIFSLTVERFFPTPVHADRWVLLSLSCMALGALVYCKEMQTGHLGSIGWVLLNNLCIVADRLLQRLMLGKDQQPVDLSKTAMLLVNNGVGMIPLLLVACFVGEYHELPRVVEQLGAQGWAWIVLSCVAGTCICYFGILVQSLISATSMLVLTSACKFAVLFIELVCIPSVTMTRMQMLGATVTILASMAYGEARSRLEGAAGKAGSRLEQAAAQAQPIETTTLWPKTKAHEATV